ncbi:MAG: hypothetical protein JXB05_15300 [Myxococcaceae bacterium]|nr:hypothetical protein [Myxococcaceae bacterium]
MHRRSGSGSANSEAVELALRETLEFLGKVGASQEFVEVHQRHIHVPLRTRAAAELHMRMRGRFATGYGEPKRGDLRGPSCS